MIKNIFCSFFLLCSLIGHAQLRYLDKLPDHYQNNAKLNNKDLLQLSDYYLTRNLNKCLETINQVETTLKMIVF